MVVADSRAAMPDELGPLQRVFGHYLIAVAATQSHNDGGVQVLIEKVH